jgi:hypothetical protein
MVSISKWDRELMTNKINKILPLFSILIPLLFISCATEKERKISQTSLEQIMEFSSSSPSEGSDVAHEEEFTLEEIVVTGSRIVRSEDEIDEFMLEEIGGPAEGHEKTGKAPSGVDFPTEDETDEFMLEEIIGPADEHEEKGDAPSEVSYTTEEKIDEFIPRDVTVTAKKPADLYKVELGADELIQMPGIPGELRVWIGLPDYDPNFRSSMVTAKDTIPAVGVTAHITPFALTFEVEPKESICMKIHPTGSEVRFTLKPTQKGIFNVGADVYLYESDDCTGSPVPKATTSLRVEVKVDHIGVITVYIKKFAEVFWEKLLKFWGAVIALFFGLLLFLIRGKLKKRFGYRDVDRQ